MNHTNIETELIFLELLNSDTELDIILNHPTEFPSELIEKLSILIAIKYWNKDIDYYDANEMICKIYGYWITNELFFNNYAFPDISWDCYNAFDAGEYHHKEDNEMVDPIDKYTNSEIETLLKKIQIIK